MVVVPNNEDLFHQLMKSVNESGLEWRRVARKKNLGGTKMLKKSFEKKDAFKALLQNRTAILEFQSAKSYQLRQ